MRIAVTGGSGRLGANLVRELLSRGDTVRALTHCDRRGLNDLGIDLIEGDVRDAKIVAGLVADVDAVVHMAAKVSIDSADRQQVLSVNVEGTRVVANACRTAQVKLIHVASIHAFDPNPVNEVIDESRALATSAYAAYDRSKAQSVQIVEEAVGLNAVIFFPTGILGPNDWRPSDMGQVLINLAKGTLPGLVVSDFDWVDARDVSRAIVAVLHRGNGRYILSGHRVSLVEMATTVQELTGTGRPRLVSPMWLARASLPFVAGLAALTGKPVLYSSDSLRVLRQYKIVSSARARRDLGHEPRPAHESLSDQIAFYRREGMLP